MFSKDQVRYLNEPIWIGALRQDRNAAKGNVYLPGSYVLAQLNRAFGYDGWSVDVLSQEAAHFGPTTTKGGGDAFRLVYHVRVRLTVRTPGGTLIVREGYGADETVSPNLQDCWQKAPASALTHAIKSAAITFGSQFGLGTVRSAKDQSGQKPDWRRRCQDKHPVAPSIHSDILLSEPALDDDDGDTITVDGQTFDARTGVEVKPAPQANARDETERLYAEETARAEQARRAATPPPQAQPVLPPQAQPTLQPEDPERRRALVQSCRALFRDRGAATAQRVFSAVAERFGFRGPMATIGAADGGASMDMLVAFEAALKEAA